MDKVSRYKEMFNKGLLTKEQIKKLKEKGVLTDKEIKEIVGGE